MSDKLFKSYFSCWLAAGADDDSDEVNKLKTALETSKQKLDLARKEIKLMKGDNLKLMSMVHLPFSNQSSEDPSSLLEEASVVIHEQKMSECGSDSKKKMSSKVSKNSKSDHQYAPVADAEYFDDELSVHSEDSAAAHDHDNNDSIRTLRQQITALHRKLMEAETSHQQRMQYKEDELTKLKRVLEKYEHAPPNTPSISKSETTNSMPSMQSISFFDASRTSNAGVSGTRLPFDHVSEQIQILNTPLLKQQSLALCREECAISNKSRDKGLITFFNKYVNEKLVEQIFAKSGEAQKTGTAMITNARGLVNVLSFAVILYKVKAHQVLNGNGNDRPKIDNAEIKNSVKFLATWIIRSYGTKTNQTYSDPQTNTQYSVYEFKCRKDAFAANIGSYLTAFVEKDGKHSDSKL